MTAELLEYENLSARRKADRGRMAARVAALAGEHGITAVVRPEQPGTRRTDVDLAGPHGLKLTVKFDASPGGTDPDTYVLSWHGVDEGVRLHWGMFNHVNSHHGHKATDVATGFAALVRTLRERFAVIADGSAFIIEEAPVPGSPAVSARLAYTSRDEDMRTLRKFGG